MLRFVALDCCRLRHSLEEINMSHLYRRGEFWYVKYYQDGHPYYRSLGTKSVRRARAIQHEIDIRLDAGVLPIPEKGKNPDIHTFWQAYLDWANDHKRPNTIALESIFWEQLISDTKIRRLGDLTPAKIELLKKKRLQKDSVSKRSINNALKHLQAIYNYAVKLGLYDGPNPFVKVDRYVLPDVLPKHLNSNQVSTLLQVAEEDGRDAHLIFAIGIFTGLRKSEIVNARWEWFDFKSKLITMQSGERFVVKDKDARTIPLHDELAAILLPYRQEKGYLIKPNQKTKQGPHRYRYDFTKLFDRVRQRAGLPWLTPHMLRHTFGSLLADEGVSIYKIMKWMGHADIRTTQRYAHLQEYDEDINRLGSSLPEDFTGNGSS